MLSLLGTRLVRRKVEQMSLARRRNLLRACRKLFVSHFNFIFLSETDASLKMDCLVTVCGDLCSYMYCSCRQRHKVYPGQ